MKKVLLVSPFPYSKTSRGMDVLTECFEQANWQTHHLTFPNVFYTVKKATHFNTTVKELIAKKSYFPYIDSIMKWFPRWLFRLMQTYQASKARFMHFGQYDYIVLESGKPLFLLNLIPIDTPIIYRQSDSVRYVLGSNKYYIGLEDMVLNRAEKIIVVKERFKNILEKDILEKVYVIRNGYTIPKDLKLVNPYKQNSINAIYVGLTKLDVHTLKKIGMELTNLNIHIFGDCLTRLDLWKLRNIKNIFYYGFQPKEQYLAYIKYANIAIFPFKDWDGMKWVGFTTKYLNFMFYKLPIVSYLTGEKSEFEGMGVRFVANENEFVNSVSKIIKSPKKIDTGIDFNFFSHAQRKIEYKKFIDTL